jgi:formamidopyrimidine-DNA glycosylase
MPELPDITVYMEALHRRLIGRSLRQIQISSPFLLRTVMPPLQELSGHRVMELRRLGKRIAIGFEEQLWLVLHLMIAGRLHWLEPGVMPKNRSVTKPGGSNPKATRSVKRIPHQQALLALDNGTLLLTEAGTKKRASIHLVRGQLALQGLNPGGLEVLDCTTGEFAAMLTSQNHTLKRALTDPRLFSGIGNAYSDEILHRARLSPVALTQRLSELQIAELHRAVRETLIWWTEHLRGEAGEDFPQNVTAFRPEMAVHGKFGKACPVCGVKVQRIRYAENETNYCPGCQTGGKLLADRSLSRLLKQDWPKTPEELEEMRANAREKTSSFSV